MYSEKSQETFKRRWDHMYGLACQYYQEHGDLLIPDLFVVPDHKHLGRWIGTQRADANKGAKTMTPEKRRKLDEIGMVWDVREAAWQQMYKAACLYYRAEGHLRISAPFVTNDGLALGEWICTARRSYQNGSLPGDRAEQLNQIAMIWSMKEEISNRWGDYYNQCTAYIEMHGGVHIPKKQKASDGKRIGEWLMRQKSAYRAGRLSPEQRRKIERFEPAYTEKERLWAVWFREAEQFYQDNLHLIIPPGTLCPCGDLHAWINTQRVQHTRGLLGLERAARLESIGMVWRTRDSGWENMFHRAELYCRAHGDLMVPRNYEVDQELSVWIANQRTDRRENRSTLTARRIARLDAIKMVWEPFEEMWELKYKTAKNYYEQNGHLVVKQDRDRDLRLWILQQRTAKKYDFLTEERRERLDEIGMVWEVQEEYWERMYAAAAAYYQIHEQLNISANYKTSDELYLGRWICGQRRTYKQLMTVEDPKTQRRFERLNEIGMIWDASKLIYFTSFQEQAVMYYVRRFVPDTVKMNTWEEYGIEIDIYLPGLRAGIEYDGFFHRKKQESDSRKNQICREQDIRLLRIREPALPELRGESEIFYLEDLSSHSLDQAIRWALDRLGLTDAAAGQPVAGTVVPTVDTERDRTVILEAYRDINAQEWDRMYEASHRFFMEHGSLDAHGLPAEETAAMRGWLTRQRRSYYDGLLTKRQTGKLEKLKFLDGAMPPHRKKREAKEEQAESTCDSAAQDKRVQQSLQKREQAERDRWDRMYALACEYYREGKKILVSGKFTTEAQAALGHWISEQRRRYRAGMLTPLEIQKLENIKMVWEPKKQAQRQWMYAAQEYYRTYRHVNAPLDYINGRGQHLGAWIARMRCKYKDGTLDSGLVLFLEKLEIWWYPLDERWERMYSYAAAFYAENGSLNVPESYQVEGEGSLLVWLHLQRQKYLKKDYMKGALTEDQAERLNAIGMVWEPYRDKWLANYALAKAYYQQHGDLGMKADFCTSGGRKLGMWISTQRQAYRGNPNYHITEERIRLLNEIGMDWRVGKRTKRPYAKEKHAGEAEFISSSAQSD